MSEGIAEIGTRTVSTLTLTHTRFCCFTFQSETDWQANGEGRKKLLRCSRCKNALYESKSAQKQHWSHHKLTCGKPPVPLPLTDVTPHGRGLCRHGNVREALDLVEKASQALGDPTSMDANTVRLFDNLRRQLEAGMKDPFWQSMALDFIRIINGAMKRAAQLKYEHAVKYYLTLWGAPGMTGFLLNSKPVEVCGAMGYSAVCFPVLKLLMSSALLSPENGRRCLRGISDGTKLISVKGPWGECIEEIGLLVIAAASRVFELWLNDGIRGSCGGHGLDGAASFCWNVIRSQIEDITHGMWELALYIPVDYLATVDACISELERYANDKKDYRELGKCKTLSSSISLDGSKAIDTGANDILQKYWKERGLQRTMGRMDTKRLLMEVHNLIATHYAFFSDDLMELADGEEYDLDTAEPQCEPLPPNKINIERASSLVLKLLSNTTTELISACPEDIKYIGKKQEEYQRGEWRWPLFESLCTSASYRNQIWRAVSEFDVTKLMIAPFHGAMSQGCRYNDSPMLASFELRRNSFFDVQVSRLYVQCL
jgi:hypothetical protein